MIVVDYGIHYLGRAEVYSLDQESAEKLRQWRIAFCDRLTMWRMKQGMTQRNLAHLIGLDPSTVSGYLSAARDPQRLKSGAIPDQFIQLVSAKIDDFAGQWDAYQVYRGELLAAKSRPDRMAEAERLAAELKEQLERLERVLRGEVEGDNGGDT